MVTVVGVVMVVGVEVKEHANVSDPWLILHVKLKCQVCAG
jgi:hypothetical protein